MAKKIRIECEARNRGGIDLIDQRTGKQAFFNRGEDVIFEGALFMNGVMLSKEDLTVVAVRFYDADNTLILEKFCEHSALNSSLTAAAWRNGNGCMFRMRVIGADTGVLPSGFFTMQVKAGLSIDSGTLLFADGKIEGVTVPTLWTGVPTTPGPPEAWTKEEADARFDFKDSGTDAATIAQELQIWTGAIGGENEYGKFLKWEAQGLSDDDKAVSRSNIGAALNGGTATIIGESSGTGNANAKPDGTKGNVISVTPGANTLIELRAPILAAGIRYLLRIQQGFRAKWTSDYQFPPNAITRGNSSGDFVKETWHPATGESYDLFELCYDGIKTHVQRFRRAAIPPACYDWMSESPFMLHNGSAFTYQVDRMGRPMGTTYGTPGYAAMAGSNFKGVSFNGSSSAQEFLVDPPVVANGITIAGVYSATSATSQNVLFYSNGLGIQIVADSDGMRFQAAGAASGTGLKVATSFGATIAFVCVIRPGSAGAFVLTTDAGGGGQTGSFTPAAGVGGGYGRWGTGSSGFTKALACIVGRTMIWRAGLNPDQARAVLDSLTEHYQLG